MNRFSAFRRATLFRAPIAAAAAVILAACSSVSIFYLFADDVIEREIAFYLDLDEPERSDLVEKIDALMAWHRADMLPRYAAFLDAQAGIIESGNITRDTVAAAYDGTRDLMFATLRGALAPAAEVLAGHTGPAKLAHLRARMTERMEDRVERSQRPRDDRIARRARRYVENIERFTGPLDPPQIALIERHAEATDADSFAWLDYRWRREQALLDFLAARPGAGEIEAFIEKALLHADEIVGPEYRVWREAGRAKFIDMMSEVIALATPEQRRTAAATLRDYASEFSRLSKRLL